MHHKIMLFFLASIFYATSFAQSFEGSFTFIKETLSDTVYYKYFVKKDKIRIDEYNKLQILTKTYFVSTSDKSITVADPERQLYASLPSKPEVEYERPQYRIIKSSNYKVINGYKCYQWRVRNSVQNTEVTYWVAKDNFNFYDELLESLNSYEKSHSFFLVLPNTDGVMPMLVVERTLLRDEKLRMYVSNIEPETLSDSVFEVPSNYISYQPTR